MAMRTGLDRWRDGLRRPVVIRIASGFTAVVLSIVAALLWGSVLAAVLLGRDALREAEKWRQAVEAAEVATTVGAAPPAKIALRPRAGDPRMILVAVDIGQGPSQELVRSLVREDPCDAAGPPRRPGRRRRSARPVGGGKRSPPSRGPARRGPSSRRSTRSPALPMTISIDADGRIEGALVGVRPAQELDALLGGKMALPPMAR
jgi:hypothetical protein